MLFEFEHGVNVIEIQLELSDRNQKAVEIIDPQSISPNHTNYTIMPTHINSTLIPGMAEVPDLQSLRSDQPKDRKIITKISKRDLIDVFTNLSRRRKNRYHGNIKHIGSPQVRLTDGAKVIGLNMDDKVFKIIRVEHIFNMTDGFVTRIGVEEYITSKK